MHVSNFLLLLSACLLFAGRAGAKQSTYVDSRPSMDRGVSVQPLPGGGFIITGASRSSSTSLEDGLVLSVSPDLETIQRKVFEQDGANFIWDIAPHGDAYTLVGFTEFPGTDRAECMVSRYHRNWDLEWSISLDRYPAERCWAIYTSADRTFVAGEAGDGSDRSLDCLIAALDPDGRLLWEETFGGSEGDRCFGIVPTSDGGLLAAGQTYSESRGQRDAFVVRVDGYGSVVWTKTWGRSGDDVAHDVSTTDDGGFLITGYSDSFGTSQTAPFIIRLTDRGEEEWVRTIEWGCHTRALSGVQVSDGGFIVIGFTRCPSPASPSAAVAKLSASGDVEWKRNFDLASPGGIIGYGLAPGQEGGAILTGHTLDESGAVDDLFIVSVSADGDIGSR